MTTFLIKNDSDGMAICLRNEVKDATHEDDIYMQVQGKRSRGGPIYDGHITSERT